MKASSDVKVARIRRRACFDARLDTMAYFAIKINITATPMAARADIALFVSCVIGNDQAIEMAADWQRLATE